MTVATTIYLKRRDLVAHGACEEGLARFDELARSQGRERTLRLTWAHLFWLLVDESTREYAVWAQRHGLLPWAHLRGADLRGADLRGAILEGADLCGADLRNADLRNADLRRADLRGADLRGATLVCAGLNGADLRRADLNGADLSGADLNGADLRNADLRGTDLYGARIDGCLRLSSDPAIPGWAVQRGVLVRGSAEVST